jgi:hypothetical protein
MGWLDSISAQNRAWGAYYAAQTKDTTFLPKLEGLAEQWEPLPPASWDSGYYGAPPKLDGRQTNERDAMTAVLDGVILLGGKLPAATLQTLANYFPVQTAVLLARLSHDEIEPTLLHLYHDPTVENPVAQRLVAEMLAVHPPPGFAASLMKGTTVLSVVEVVNPENGLHSGQPVGGICGDGGLPDPEWPVVGQYRVVFYEPSPGVIEFPVVQGTDPIYAMRTAAVRTIPTGSCTGVDRLDYAGRMEVVARMLGVEQSSLPFGAQRSRVEETMIPATSVAEYTKKVTEFVDEEEKKFLELETQLQQKGLITAEEIERGEARPRLVLSLHDSRYGQENKFELPEIASPAAERVEWTTPNIWWVR